MDGHYDVNGEGTEMAALLKTGGIATLMIGVFAAGFASDALIPNALAQVGINGANLADPHAALTQQHHAVEAPGVTATLTDNRARRFEQTTPTPDDPQAEAPRQLEFEVQAPAVPGLNISLAQRASLGADRHGDINRQGRGSEVRVALGDPGRSSANEPEHRVYLFAGSDDEALTWQPGSNGNGVQLQDRVEVGDRQAGVTYERHGVQASLAYVERKVSATVGQTTHSDNESFAGVTLTMRH